MENKELFKILTGQNPLDFELTIKLDGKINRDYYHKDEIILVPGQVPDFIWYIDKGTAMGYFFREGKKIVLFLRNEGSFIIPVQSFFSREPSNIYIQLIESSVLRSISYDHFKDLENAFPGTNECINRIIMEHNELANGEGIEESEVFKDRQERINNIPAPAPISERLSAVSISNYLGISIKTVYRMRSRNKKKE